MKGSELAKLLISQSKEKAKAKFVKWQEVELPEELKHLDAKEVREILRNKYLKLKGWYAKSASPKPFFDVAHNSEEELLRAWAGAFVDWKNGLKPLPGTPEFSELAFVMKPDEINIDNLEVPEERFFPYIPFNWISLLSERFFAAFCIEYLDTLLADSPKPVKQEFSPEMYVVVKSALKQKELITSSGIYTGKPTQLKALYNVLEKRSYILGIKKPEDSFAKWFHEHFGVLITDRALRNPPNRGQEEEERDFKALIPDNK